MTTSIRRGTIVSFEPTTYKALVMLDGSLSEVEMAVGEWVPGSLLAADDQVAVLLFADTNQEDGVILGPFGAASGLLALSGTPSNGRVPIGNGTGLTLAALTGTANRVTVANGAGSITLSAPQDLHTTADPTFDSLCLGSASGAASGELELSGAIRESTALQVQAYNSAAISIVNNNDVALTFNSERGADPDGMHNTLSNTGRLTCVTPGLYVIIGNVEFAHHTTGTRAAWIRLNGSTRIATQAVGATPAAGSLPTQLVVATLRPLAANDYVELMVYQNSGGSLNVTVQGEASPAFMMARLA